MARLGAPCDGRCLLWGQERRIRLPSSGRSRGRRRRPSVRGDRYSATRGRDRGRRPGPAAAPRARDAGGPGARRRGAGPAGPPVPGAGGGGELGDRLRLVVTVQALPFLVLGVTVSAGHRRLRLAGHHVPPAVPGPAGVRRPGRRARRSAALPGCECGSVPIARRLMSSGRDPGRRPDLSAGRPGDQPGGDGGSTAVAFPGQPEVVGGPLPGQPDRGGRRRTDLATAFGR